MGTTQELINLHKLSAKSAVLLFVGMVLAFLFIAGGKVAAARVQRGLSTAAAKATQAVSASPGSDPDMEGL